MFSIVGAISTADIRRLLAHEIRGRARGKYTFFGRLEWTRAIALGNGASIVVHMWINAGRF